MTTLTIKVTKEILERSKWCRPGAMETGTNCAISLAVRDIFPDAYVGRRAIFPLRDSYACWGELGFEVTNRTHAIELPIEAAYFIEDFDNISPEQRVNMPELSFEVEIPDAVIERIDITAVTELLQNHPTLQLQTT